MPTKLGETNLAWIASERGLAAAQLADNAVVLGSLLRSVAHALHSTGRFQTAIELTEAALPACCCPCTGRCSSRLRRGRPRR